MRDLSTVIYTLFVGIESLCGPAIIATLAISCSDSAAPPAVPGSLQIVSGYSQEGTVGSELHQPLKVRVLGQDANPIPGLQVNFVVTGGGGVLSSPSALTNNDGVAEDRWTIGKSTSENQTAQARVAVDESRGLLIVARFQATPHADAPDTVRVVSGDGQSAVANTAAADSLLAIVVDRFGNPVPGAVVDWSVSANGGTLSRATDTTSAPGYTSAKFTAGNQAGDYEIIVAVGQVARNFVVHVTPPPLTLNELVGTHRLDSLLGRAVPFAYAEGERLITVDSGSLEILANGTGVLTEVSSQRNCPLDICDTITSHFRSTATVSLDGNVIHFGADTGTVMATGISLYGAYGRYGATRRVYRRNTLPSGSATRAPAGAAVNVNGDRRQRASGSALTDPMASPHTPAVKRFVSSKVYSPATHPGKLRVAATRDSR